MTTINSAGPIARSDARGRSRDYSEYLLYLSLKVTLVVLSFYAYFVGMSTVVSTLKDGLIGVVVGATLLDLIARRSRPHWDIADGLVWLLALYLVAELIRTAVRIDSFPVAYLGFRLDFMPVLLYFGFRRIDSDKYRASLYRLFVSILVIGVALTLVEFGLTASGLVPAETIAQWLNAAEDLRGITLGEFWPRVIGIGGRSHTTGIYHVVLLGVLLCWRQSGGRRGWAPSLVKWPGVAVLSLVATAATIVSTGKTAWFAMPIIVIVAALGQRRLGWRGLGIVVLAFLFVYVIVFSSVEQYELILGQQILGFLSLYRAYFGSLTEDVWRDEPVFGYGYEYEMRITQFQAPKITLENQPVATDIYMAAVLRMLGAVGLTLFGLLFWVAPLCLALSRNLSEEGRGAALGVLAIGVAFAHYSPLTSPVTAVAAWYLMALMAREWSTGYVRRPVPEPTPSVDRLVAT